MSKQGRRTAPIIGFRGSDRPRGAADVETAVFEGEAVVYHDSARMVHRLNSLAAAVFLLCDGDTSVDAMAIELGEVFELEPATLVDGIDEALHHIGAAGLLEGVDAAPRRPVPLPATVVPDGSRLLTAPPDP